MDASKFFQSRWLSAEDVGNREVDATIEDSVEEKVGEDQKLVLYLVGFKKGLVLNATNYKRLKKEFGTETNNWKGKAIRLYTIMVPFKGEDVPALRIKMPEQTPQEEQPFQKEAVVQPPKPAEEAKPEETPNKAEESKKEEPSGSSKTSSKIDEAFDAFGP
jgi:hypothetical protein